VSPDGTTCEPPAVEPTNMPEVPLSCVAMVQGMGVWDGEGGMEGDTVGVGSGVGLRPMSNGAGLMDFHK
jgi:hypothetical protein